MSLVATAEISRPDLNQLAGFAVAEQRYAHSNSALIAYGGKQAIKNEVALESPEARAAKADNRSAIIEMVSTHPKFKDKLHLEDTKRYSQVGEIIFDKDGRDLAEMIQAGAETSKKMADDYEEFESLAIRDQGDVEVMNIVNNLKPGETYIAGSLAPVGALKKFPATYKELGFSDITYLQSYTKNADGSVEASFVSVKDTNLKAWVRLMREKGFNIPDGVTEDTFIIYGKVVDLNGEDALELLKDTREEYYDIIGANYDTDKSATNFVDANQAVLDQVFGSLYPHLSRAVYSGENNKVMQEYARNLLKAELSKELLEDVRTNLIKVANSNKFDGNMAQTMEMVFRYATVEILGTKLEYFINTPKTSRGRIGNFAINSSSTSAFIEASYVDLNRVMIGHTINGIEAGRSYGGCAGNAMLAEESGDLGGNISSTSNLNHQLTFGGYGRSGRMGRERWKLRKGKCGVKSCPTRPGEVTIGPCGVCIDRCQKLFDKGTDPTKMSSTKKSNVRYSNKPKESKNGFFDNGTTKAQVKFNMAPSKK